MLLEDIVLALALVEANQLQALALDEGLDGTDESPGHGDGLFGGGKAVSQVSAAKRGDTGLTGELGDVGVQVHPVDALQFHADVFLLELGEVVRYVHGESGWAFVLQNMEQPPLVGNTPAPPGAVPPNRTDCLRGGS